MKDELVKALICDGRVRIYICATTALVEEARTRFDMWPTTAAALGRTLTVGSMIGSMLKSDKEQITIRINGGGPIGTLMVDAYSDGHVRGFVSEPHCHFQYEDTGKLAVGMAVGTDGYLEVIKDVGGKDNWKGTVELQSGEIGDDFAYYFTISEQTPSAVSLGVLVDTDHHIISAGGLIIQVLPDATDDDLAYCENVVNQLKPMSTLINESQDLENALFEVFKDAKILSKQPIEFRCHCSELTMKRALLTLPQKDRKAMIEEDHGCEITCNFCNERYHFNEEELIHLEEFMETYGNA